jgi:RNA 2',3'-cyclic 3'-phosphodiesterase
MPRLFFALRPEPGQAEAMAEAARPLLQALGGNAVAVVDLHLTLHFLGEVPEDRIDALAMAAASLQPRFLQLALSRIDCWPAARVVCLLPGSGTSMQATAKLARQLRVIVQAAGLPTDAKPFRPHVTVGRKIPKGSARQPAWPQQLAAPLQLAADGFVLMQGAQGPGGARYVVRRAWPATTDA